MACLVFFPYFKPCSILKITLAFPVLRVSKNLLTAPIPAWVKASCCWDTEVKMNLKWWCFMITLFRLFWWFSYCFCFSISVFLRWFSQHENVSLYKTMKYLSLLSFKKTPNTVLKILPYIKFYINFRSLYSPYLFKHSVTIGFRVLKGTHAT